MPEMKHLIKDGVRADLAKCGLWPLDGLMTECGLSLDGGEKARPGDVPCERCQRVRAGKKAGGWWL